MASRSQAAPSLSHQLHGKQLLPDHSCAANEWLAKQQGCEVAAGHVGDDAPVSFIGLMSTMPVIEAVS